MHDTPHDTPHEPLPNLPTDRRALLAGIGGLAAGALLAGKANAGPLNPPAGPIAPTPGPEARIAINAVNTPGDSDSLFQVTQPGSYYLTGNITGVSGKHGIEIAASGVTLDLNGFDLVGVPASLSGVTTTESSLANITVQNGSVRSWGAAGVFLASSSCVSTTVRRVSASANATTGIAVSNGGTIEQCIASNNGSIGIFASTGSTVSGCTASGNAGDGIQASTGSTITACTASFNGLAGLKVGSGCTITACTSFGNDGNGIEALAGCTIRSNSVRYNSLDGIRLSSQSVVTGNACTLNGAGAGGDGAGIHATSSDNRIEDNNCTSANRGIDVDAPGNIIIKNTCSGNSTNWDVVAGNIIFVFTASVSGAVTGDLGGGSPGSTNPNANYTY